MTRITLELTDSDNPSAIPAGLPRPARRIQINKDVTSLGREPGIEVEINSAAAVVSRRHAEIRRQGENYLLVDLGSSNGTFLNGRRIEKPELLRHNDRIELGPGGPTILVHETVYSPEKDTDQAARNQFQPTPGNRAANGVSNTPTASFIERSFGNLSQLTIGRGDECDIQLDGLLISNQHARVSNTNSRLTIEDLNSTNGTYVNGERISGRKSLLPEDVIQIGPFLLRVHPERGVTVFDTRAKTRIDAVKIIKEVPNRSGAGKIRLLDEVSLSILPNEFIGMLGPSGAGKSTLMDSLNGMRPASSGQVLVNNLDLYQHLESLKQSIGYVPQDDIIHRELTVYRTLYYVARLRLSRDISPKEIDQIINEVLDVTQLVERRDVLISQLSGGQRKRVSIAVELITKPSVIFLDEPTSGLDPATEEKVMNLFRQLAESGRTVILTTHAMENVRLFDKIVLLMRGKLVFYGSPNEALAHVGAESFKDLYDKLEAPINQRLAETNGPVPREVVAEEVAEQWKRRFIQTDQYRLNVETPLQDVSARPRHDAPARRQGSVGDSLRQWVTLSRRYMEVMGSDKTNLLILFAQAPIIALLTYVVVGEKVPRDFLYFILSLVALWFGASVSAREIIRERAVFNRERMVNLRLVPYIAAKLFVLLLIVSVQCFLLFGSMKLLDVAGLMSVPGLLGGVPHLLVMILTGLVGIALGLFISTIVRTSEMATSLVPLILIPQILFCGLVGIPAGAARALGVIMPATWSFDEMKRLSELDVLRGQDEGAQPAFTNEGRGLYSQIERKNAANINGARQRLDRYKSEAEGNSRKFQEELDHYLKEVAAGRASQKPIAPTLGAPPQVSDAEKIPGDLSRFVDFLHPWGAHVTDLGLLVFMFFGSLAATTLVLRSQDIL